MEKLVEQIKKIATVEYTDYWPKDWVLRLLALFFAIFLWYFVVGEDKVDTHLLVPVELVNLPRDLVIANQFKQQLEVTITGPRGLIDGLRRQPITRTINLAEAKPGTMAIRNEAESLPFPRGIEVLRIQPAHTTLVIDRLKEKMLPIQAETRGEPAPGFELASLRLEPAAITINGPEALLDRINLLRTTPIDLSGLNSTTIRQTPLLLDQELLELLGEAMVNAMIEIQEKTGELTLREVEPVLIDRREQFSYTLSPRALQLRLLAPLSLHRDPAALRQRVVLTLQVGELEAGSHRLPPLVTTDDKISVVAINPEQITVKVTETK
ncbi:YbbR-like domain-containing protein [Desulfurivibrio sp. D14AmB]|uniref:CdaR family protein n=1 Tax=Desulfurivibrio sp. D14AmB TaxID=3374370 RepID=UPI00376EE09A